MPLAYGITSLYPNPFNPDLTVELSLPVRSNLQLTVHNVLGQEVAVIAKGSRQAGVSKFHFNAEGLTSGIYFIRAVVPGNMNQVEKVILMK